MKAPINIPISCICGCWLLDTGHYKIGIGPFVVCPICGLKGKPATTMDEAINNWNKMIDKRKGETT